MERRYTYATTLAWGGDIHTGEADVEVSYTVTGGRAETPPAYSHGGLPAEPAMVEGIRLEKVDGKPRPWGMYDGWIPIEDDEFERDVIDKLEDHHDEMIAEAAEQDAPDPDDARDRAIDDRPTEAA